MAVLREREADRAAAAGRVRADMSVAYELPTIATVTEKFDAEGLPVYVVTPFATSVTASPAWLAFVTNVGVAELPSSRRSTVLSHCVHAPLLQYGIPIGHTVPHMPQFFASNCVSVHIALQTV
jgi:hypothetical protein